MKNQNEQTHQAKIIEQFTRQAIPFTQVQAHSDAVQVLIELSDVCKNDNVLDVACGPGIVTCEFALYADHVSGIDITPEMILQAEKRQLEKGIKNMTWDIGNSVSLPYPDNSFSIVLTRYSFHHLLEPQRTLSEMIRVCKTGGMVIVADVAVESSKSKYYDNLEKMRDPSHTHALTHEEFALLFLNSGLSDCIQSSYDVNIELGDQLRASFPNSGDESKLRDMIMNDIGINQIGINARKENNRIIYTVPISVYAGKK